MSGKEYLEQVYRFHQRILSKEAELESYRDLSMSISGSGYERNYNATRNTDPPYVKYSNKIMDIEQEIKTDQAELGNLKYAVGLEIDRLESVNERMVLRYRYLMFMTWGEVAKKLHYSKRWVIRIHDRAIFNFERMMEEKKDEL